jgi:predicted GNAT family acetyltransferase
MDGVTMKPGTREHGPATLKLGFNTSVPAHLRGGLLEVTHVHTPEGERRKGYASLLMQKVCAEADAAGKVLMLMPKPYDDGPLDVQALLDWYGGFGFEPIQTKPVIMARRPGAVAVRVKPLAYAMGTH